MLVSPLFSVDSYVKHTLFVPTLDQHHHHNIAWKAVDKSRAWLHCVSRRSGLPFWLLSSLLFMGFAFLLWLCCSSLAGSHREDKEKVSE